MNRGQTVKPERHCGSVDSATERTTPGADAIEGRTEIARALSEIMGVPISVKAVDRLAERRRRPLPLHGYPGRRWAFREELRQWWATVDFRASQSSEQGIAG